MFKQFTVKNFRTHQDTTISLGEVTLFIGPNSSGKTNFLRALTAFSYFGRLARPYYDRAVRKVEARFMANRWRFAQGDTPISFACDWENDGTTVTYQLILKQNLEGVVCEESIAIRSHSCPDLLETNTSDGVYLASILHSRESLTKAQKNALDNFFRSLGSIYFYHFEPSSLRLSGNSWEAEQIDKSADLGLSSDREQDGVERFNIYRELKSNGGGLVRVLDHLKQNDAEPRLYERFKGLMESFDTTFREFKIERYKGEDVPYFSFRMDNKASRADDFRLNAIPDGFLRACAVSVLCSLSRPPSMILLEEIENGLDIVRLELISRWLKEAAVAAQFRRHNSQFFITSHSPIMLRAFSDRLESVYQVRMDKTKLCSVGLNLNEYIKMQIDAGVVNGTVEHGQAQVHPDTLVKLWINRRIGGDVPDEY